MYSILLPILATGLATVANAYTKPGANTWGPLLTPDLSQSITQGKEFTVTWDPEDHPTKDVTVSLVLCHGPSSNCVPEESAIASGIPADQKSFDWTVPCDLAPGKQNTDTGYGLLIIVDGTGEFQYSTQFSCLENKSCSSGSGSGPSSSPSNTTSTITTGGSVIILPPTQQTGSASSSEDNTIPHSITTTGGWGGATTAATSGPVTYLFNSTISDALPGTTLVTQSGATTAPLPATTVAGGSTNSASAPAASASTFGGGAAQLGWNAAGAVVAGAAVLFVL